MKSQPDSKGETVKKILTFTERRAEIQKLMERVGPWNLNAPKLAKEYSCSKNIIYHDIRKIIERVGPEELKTVTFNLMLGYKASTKASWDVLANSKDPALRLKAAETLSRVCDKFSRFLGIIGPDVKIFNMAQFNQQNVQKNITVIDFEKERETVKEAIKCIHEELLAEKSRLSPKEQA